MSEHEQDLQDLSANDADELKAFVAKGRWFEAKLKELENHQPIYPFVQFPAKPKAEGPSSEANLSQVQYELPTEEQLAIWQADRDAIEEEVISFDGGDLERMKRKTRAVTVVPLTAPSTELVEITLDLILLIDRLLVLLRHRSELLDLTVLRRQWETLRTSCTGEMRSIESELAAIQQEMRSWILKQPAVPLTTQVTQAESDDREIVPVTPPRSSLGPKSSNNSSPRPSMSPSVESSPIHLVSPNHSPSRLTPLRSRLNNVEIRHSTVASTMIPRAAACLDRMIDIAGPLAGLGGVHGPISSEAQTAAVPEELLDAQDEAELESGRLAQGMQQCRGALKQCAVAENHIGNSLHVSKTAGGLLVRLEGDNDQELNDIRTCWQNASARISPPFEWHPTTEDDSRLSRNEIASLTGPAENARHEAIDALKQCETRLLWREQLCEQRSIVLACLGELQVRADEVTKLLNRGDDFAEIGSSFSLGHTGHGASVALVTDIDAWQETQVFLDARRPNLSHRMAVARLRHRAIMGSVPPNLESPGLAKDEDTLSTLDDRHEAFMQNIIRLRMLRTRLDGDNQMRTLVSDLNEVHDRGRIGLLDVFETLQTRIDAVIWTGAAIGPQATSNDDLDAVLNHIDCNTIVPSQDLCSQIAKLGHSETRYTHVIHNCQTSTGLIRSEFHRARQLRHLLDKAAAQTMAVNVIREEAVALLAKIEPVSTGSRTETEEEVAEWLSALANRIPYLSTGGHSTFSDSHRDMTSTRVSSQTVTTSPITPPISPPLGERTQSDLAAVDRMVRDEINRQAARVSGALTHAISLEAAKVGSSTSDDQGIAKVSAMLLSQPSTSRSTSTSRASASLGARQARYGALGGPSQASRVRATRPEAEIGVGSKPSSVRSEQRSTSVPHATGRIITGSSTSSAGAARALTRSTTPFRSVDSSQASEDLPHPRHLALSARSSRHRAASGASNRPATPATPTRKSRKYVPDSRNQLDVAVGGIINDLKKHVPIAPIGSTVRDEYKDTTGSYWIGAEGRAKLYFCRILRSKTVMVRVGGGWVELSKFLEAHFSSAELSPDAPSPSSGFLDASRNATETPVTTPVRMRVSSASAILQGTPVRGSPRALVDSDEFLTPLRFMTKASDTPDARLKEKAKLKVGRRSILGKERDREHPE